MPQYTGIVYSVSYMSERPSERGTEHSSESLKKIEKPSSVITPETKEDLRMKEVFSSVLTELRPAMESDVQGIQQLVTDLRKREWEFTNFLSPENMLGQSTWIRGDGKTFSWERLETVESMLEIYNLRLAGMKRMESMIKSWVSLENIKKDPFVAKFLNSPEWLLMLGVLFSVKDTGTLEAEYYLAKARELKSTIIRGDELAQNWYDKLEGTPLEKVGQEERMSLGSRTLRKGREFANSMLGLDSLAMMVAGIGVGRLAGTLISKSDKLRNVALAGSTTLNNGNLATRMAVPAVNVLRSKAWEGLAMQLSKGWANFLLEIAKGFTYVEIARMAGGEKMAHAISYPLMFIPGAKAEFEASLRISLAKNPENFVKFAEWIKKRYWSPAVLEQVIVSGYTEQMQRQWAKIWQAEKSVFEKEAKDATALIFGTNVWKMKTVGGVVGAKAPLSNAWKGGLAEWIGTHPNPSLKTPWSSQTPLENPNNPSNSLNTSYSPTSPETQKTPAEHHRNTRNPEAKTVPNTPKELPEIETDAEFEQFVRTIFEKHGNITLRNEDIVVQNLLEKWRNYRLLQLKNVPESARIYHQDGSSGPKSLLDADRGYEILPAFTKNELVKYVDGIRTTSELMEWVDDWALMSSNSLFLVRKEYRYLPDDLDISIDRKDFTKAWQNLMRMVQSGKVTNVHKKAIVGHEALYGKWNEVPDADIPKLMAEGNFKIVFDLKTKTGKSIETEFFVEDKGLGFTQIGHMDHTIESVNIKGKEVKYLSEHDAAEWYAINLLDEWRRNAVEGFAGSLKESLAKWTAFDPPKAKDGTRVLNLLVYLEGMGVSSPAELAAFTKATAEKYREASGGVMSKALESATNPKNVEALHSELNEVLSVRAWLRNPKSTIELPDFEVFRTRLAEKKREVVEIYLSVSEKSLTGQEKMDSLRKLDTMWQENSKNIKKLGLDNQSFPYIYELYKYQARFIEATRQRIQTN